MTTVSQIAALMLSSEGDAYIYGVEVSPSEENPAAFDCSELVQWACNRLGVEMPDGSWIQARFCNQHHTNIPVAEALATYGALLFRFSSDPYSGGRPASAHVAMSLGNGTTIEARSTRLGVGIFEDAYERTWTHAALIPNVTYPTTEEDPNPMDHEHIPPAGEIHEWADGAWAEWCKHSGTNPETRGWNFQREDIAWVYTRVIKPLIARVHRLEEIIAAIEAGQPSEPFTALITPTREGNPQ